MTTPLLQVSKASLLRNRKKLFNPVSFELSPGEVFLLQGPNGLGKSLFLRYLALQQLPSQFRFCDEGKVKLQTQTGVFYLPQVHVPEIPLTYTLGEIACFNVEKKTGDNPAWFGASLAKVSWNQASGGQKMRALLARAFRSSAHILMLDEPFNHLDPLTKSQLSETIIEESKGPRKRAFLLVSHTASENFSNSDDSSIFDDLTLHSQYKSLSLTPHSESLET